MLWVEAGADLYVTTDAQTGLRSESNVLYHGASPQAVTGTNRVSLTDWQSASGSASGQDSGSSGADPLFVDIDGADNVLGYRASGAGYDGGLDDNFYRSRNSSAIDHGHSWLGAGADIEGFGRVDDPGTPNVTPLPDTQAGFL